jgi:signal transduction histidine kinase
LLRRVIKSRLFALNVREGLSDTSTFRASIVFRWSAIWTAYCRQCFLERSPPARNELSTGNRYFWQVSVNTLDVPDVHWAREVIDRQVQTLSRLIDDLMDVSRVNQRNVKLQREHVELAKVVQGAIETSRPLIEEMGHELVVTQPTDLVTVAADPTR